MENLKQNHNMKFSHQFNRENVNLQDQSYNDKSYIHPNDKSYIHPNDKSYIHPNDKSYLNPSEKSYIHANDNKSSNSNIMAQNTNMHPATFSQKLISSNINKENSYCQNNIKYDENLS